MDTKIAENLQNLCQSYTYVIRLYVHVLYDEYHMQLNQQYIYFCTSKNKPEDLNL